jgi:hypothetical protein
MGNLNLITMNIMGEQLRGGLIMSDNDFTGEPMDMKKVNLNFADIYQCFHKWNTAKKVRT